jgi:hypothetical protein
MKYQPKINPTVKAAIKAILNETNAMGSDRQADVAFTICETVKGDHNTLQQCFWSALLKAQMQYADARHDLRNEDAVNLAKAVKDTAVSLNFDYGLRFI